MQVTRWLITLAAAVAVLGVGCAGSTGSVDWENYTPEVKQRIDSMAAAGDCMGLQAEFDTAEANDAAQRERTGDGNADVMGYIDDKMSSAGCYER